MDCTCADKGTNLDLLGTFNKEHEEEEYIVSSIEACEKEKSEYEDTISNNIAKKRIRLKNINNLTKNFEDTTIIISAKDKKYLIYKTFKYLIKS